MSNTQKRTVKQVAKLNNRKLQRMNRRNAAKLIKLGFYPDAFLNSK